MRGPAASIAGQDIWSTAPVCVAGMGDWRVERAADEMPAWLEVVCGGENPVQKPGPNIRRREGGRNKLIMPMIVYDSLLYLYLSDQPACVLSIPKSWGKE